MAKKFTRKEEEIKLGAEESSDNIYGKGDRGVEALKFAQNEIAAINKALELREQKSIVFNGVSYSLGYEYNQKKGINYAPPKGADDSEISLGLVHEKILSFVAIFLKYVFKKGIKCYSQNGKLIEGLGVVYELAIDFSQRLEKLNQKIYLIYSEVFTQGDAFVLEDWEVKTFNRAIAKHDGEVLNPENM